MAGVLAIDLEAGKEERPARQVTVEDFQMEETAVTNDQFGQFVRETGFKTDSEKFGWSFVFHTSVPNQVKVDVSRAVKDATWWLHVDRAFWKQPFGPGTNVDGKGDFPVVHASWNDAKAYCRWAGKRLPSDKEWEFAARGGLVDAKYPWGNELDPKRMNTWQGAFPMQNSKLDGFEKVAPANSLAPNAYGLYNMLGNVWEWVDDEFAVRLFAAFLSFFPHHRFVNVLARKASSEGWVLYRFQ